MAASGDEEKVFTPSMTEADGIRMLDAAMQRGKVSLSKSEEEGFRKSMASPEFRQYMEEYVKSLADPKNKAEQEAYLQQLEKQGDVPKDVELAHPTPYAALKLKANPPGSSSSTTSSGGAASGAGEDAKSSEHSKIFINVCLLEDCDVMTLKQAKGKKGMELRVPTMLNQPTYVMDNKQNPTLSVDVCVSPKTMQMAGRRGARMVKEVLGVCCAEAVRQLEARMHVTSLHMDPRAFIVLQGTKYMGGAKKPAAINVFASRQKKRAVEERVAKLRKESSSAGAGGSVGGSSDSEKKSGAAAGGKGGGKTAAAAGASDAPALFPDGAIPVPPADVTITERGSLPVTIPHSDIAKVEAMLPRRPETLVLRVHCKGLAKVSAAALDVQQTKVLLEYPVPAKAASKAGVKEGTYRLQRDLPHPVDVESCKAAFVRSKQRLEVTMRVVPHKLDAQKCAELVAKYDKQAGLVEVGGATAVQEVSGEQSGEQASSTAVGAAGTGAGAATPASSDGEGAAAGHSRWVSGSSGPSIELPGVAPAKATDGASALKTSASGKGGAAVSTDAAKEDEGEAVGATGTTGQSAAAMKALKPVTDGAKTVADEEAEAEVEAEAEAPAAATKPAPYSPDRYSAEAMLHAAQGDTDSESDKDGDAAAADLALGTGAGEAASGAGADAPLVTGTGSVLPTVVRVSDPVGFEKFLAGGAAGGGSSAGDPVLRPPFAWRQSEDHLVLLVQVPLAEEGGSSVVLRRRGGAGASGSDGGGELADELEVCLSSRIGAGFVERLRKQKEEEEGSGEGAAGLQSGDRLAWGAVVPSPRPDGEAPRNIAGSSDPAEVQEAECPRPGEPSPWFASFDLAREGAGGEGIASRWRLRVPLAGPVQASSARLDASDCNVAVWVTKAEGHQGEWGGLVQAAGAAAGAQSAGGSGGPACDGGGGAVAEAASPATKRGCGPGKAAVSAAGAVEAAGASQATGASKAVGSSKRAAAPAPTPVAAPRVRLSDATKALADDLD